MLQRRRVTRECFPVTKDSKDYFGKGEGWLLADSVNKQIINNNNTSLQIYITSCLSL